LLITLPAQSFAAANWVKFPGPAPEWTNWVDTNSVSREGALTTFDMLTDNKGGDPVAMARNPNAHNKIGFNCKYEQIYQFICKAR